MQTFVPPPIAAVDLRPARLPTAAVVLVATIWGVTFSVVDSAADSLPPADLVALRFGLAALVLLPVRGAVRLNSVARRRGIVLGVLFGGGFLLQALAMQYTDALMSGFLTSLLVVIAPVTGWLLFRERIGRPALLAIGVAMLGVAVLTLRGGGFGPGESLTCAAAALWGLHVVLLSRWSEPGQAVGLARVQVTAVAAMGLCVVAGRGLLTGTSIWPALPATAATWMAVVFLAAVATALAMVLLSWAQSRLSATRTAILLTLEPATSAVTVVVLGGALNGATVVGCGLLLAAMVLVDSTDRIPSWR